MQERVLRVVSEEAKAAVEARAIAHRKHVVRIGVANECGDRRVNISGEEDHQHVVNVPAASNTQSQRRISRRAVLFGLAGVAIGSTVSSGLWIAKSAGIFDGNSHCKKESFQTTL